MTRLSRGRLNVYEEVNRDVPFGGLHWFFDHCETISDRNIERIKALGGGIAIQHRMAFQGEYFVDRYGAKQAERTPPIRRMLELGVPVGAGTDATRVANYNPFVVLYWLVTGKTVGGAMLYPERKSSGAHGSAAALHGRKQLVLQADKGKKGSIAAGQLADLAVLSAEYFSIPEEQIKQLESVLDNRRRQSCVRDQGVLEIRAAAAARQSRVVARENLRRLLANRFSSGQIGKGGRCDENGRHAKSWLAPRHAEPLAVGLRMLCLTCLNGRDATGLAT